MNILINNDLYFNLKGRLIKNTGLLLFIYNKNCNLAFDDFMSNFKNNFNITIEEYTYFNSKISKYFNDNNDIELLISNDDMVMLKEFPKQYLRDNVIDKIIDE